MSSTAGVRGRCSSGPRAPSSPMHDLLDGGVCAFLVPVWIYSHWYYSGGRSPAQHGLDEKGRVKKANSVERTREVLGIRLLGTQEDGGCKCDPTAFAIR